MRGKTGGQQGDPLEMLIFNLTILHLWGSVLARFPETRAIAYAEELNVSKTSVLPKGVTQQAAFDAAHNIINVIPTLTHLSGDVLLVSFCPESFVGIGVP